MLGPIRYHLDESVTTVVAVALRRRGIDVTTTAEVGLTSATDEEQLFHAKSTGRVLVTRDHDFLILASRGVQHAGIVFWPPQRQGVGDVINLLTLLWRTDTAESIVGNFDSTCLNVISHPHPERLTVVLPSRPNQRRTRRAQGLNPQQ